MKTRKGKEAEPKTIHESGWKGQRDRDQAVRKYFEVAKFFHEKPESDIKLATLSNQEIYNLGEAVYLRQPKRKQIYYAKSLGKLRENDLSFAWWWKDVVRTYNPNILGIIVLAARSPWLYAHYRKQKKAWIAMAKKAWAAFPGETQENAIRLYQAQEKSISESVDKATKGFKVSDEAKEQAVETVKDLNTVPFEKPKEAKA